MALHIYSATPSDTPVSSEGSFTNPLEFSFDGVKGGILYRKLFVRNDNINKKYTGITLSIVDSSPGSHLIDETLGYSWKLIQYDSEPAEGQFALISSGNTIIIPDISDEVTYVPFYMRIQVFPGVTVNSFKTISLQINATELKA